jgi:hypothetical protein
LNRNNRQHIVSVLAVDFAANHHFEAVKSAFFGFRPHDVLSVISAKDHYDVLTVTQSSKGYVYPLSARS